MSIEKRIILKLITEKASSRADFTKIVAEVYAVSHEKGYHRNVDLRDTYVEMLKLGEIEPSSVLEKLLVTKKMRSLSGVSVITVLTKPYPCPGKCIYCPTLDDVPKSYLPDEPAVMRAILNKYDAASQVRTRLDSLVRQGHPVDKIELIVIGGTFSHLPRDYQEEYVKSCFDALNGVASVSLDEAKKFNETAKSRCVGLTLETRPDHIDSDEVAWFRYLGATRVELGVQTVFDGVLRKNGRGETSAETAEATRLLKNAGFKICYHLMPNLYGSNLDLDKKMFHEIFNNQKFRPDYIKIYPCMVLKNTALHDLWSKGEYKSYTDSELKELIKYVKEIVPPWIRIMRTIRDIPAPNIVSGSILSNMRQIVLQELAAEEKSCGCIRCREVGVRRLDGADGLGTSTKLFIDEYKASGGTEYFMSYEDAERKTLYSLLRLRLPEVGDKKPVISTLEGCALIREVHTYGQQIEVGGAGETQHKGLGRKLILAAEKVAKDKGYKKIAVISGVGVRDYYRKFDYELDGEYMVKSLD